jgi:hypothetical protein
MVAQGHGLGPGRIEEFRIDIVGRAVGVLNKNSKFGKRYLKYFILS